MSNNQKPEGEVKKKCPFSGEWCGDWCPLFSQLTEQRGGMVKQTNMCAFVATNIILSQMNAKAVQAPQKQMPQIHLPGNLRTN